MSDQTTGHSQDTRPDSDEIAVGRIKGSWGLRGDLVIESLTDFPDRFSPGSVLNLDGRPARVESSRATRRGFVVKLDLVSDRTEADSHLGKLVTVPGDDVRPLPDGSYYQYQIVGLGVWTVDGEPLGQVKEVLSTGSNDVYVVSRTDGGEVLIPALESVVVEVDVDGGKMVVDLPDGLL